MVWSPSRGLHKHILFSKPCASPQAGVAHNAMLTYCLALQACFLSEYYSACGFKAFGLATNWTSLVFICRHVSDIESHSVCMEGVKL